MRQIFFDKRITNFAGKILICLFFRLRNHKLCWNVLNRKFNNSIWLNFVSDWRIAKDIKELPTFWNLGQPTVEIWGFFCQIFIMTYEEFLEIFKYFLIEVMCQFFRQKLIAYLFYWGRYILREGVRDEVKSFDIGVKKFTFISKVWLKN